MTAPTWPPPAQEDRLRRFAETVARLNYCRCGGEPGVPCLRCAAVEALGLTGTREEIEAALKEVR